MIDHSNAEIEQISVHFTGNKAKEENLILSESPLDLSDVRSREFLFQYFLGPFQNPEYYEFSGLHDDATLNPMFRFACGIFDESNTFHEASRNLARHLYEISDHPNIKSGDLFVVYFSNISMEDEVTDAIGIFKCEHRDVFLKLLRHQSDATVEWHEGIGIDKLDKGCLIFNTERNSGFRVCIVDKSNKSEAQYWRETFLQLQPSHDDYHATRVLMNITKQFVTEELADEREINRADQIDLLNRSALYFKSHDAFDKEDFETEVLQDPGTIKAFRTYDGAYRTREGLMSEDRFDISPHAVKRHASVLRSVLKLDKNFHIYIHGDRDLIQAGMEKDGRKFYKIYFEKEA